MWTGAPSPLHLLCRFRVDTPTKSPSGSMTAAIYDLESYPYTQNIMLCLSETAISEIQGPRAAEAGIGIKTGRRRNWRRARC